MKTCLFPLPILTKSQLPSVRVSGQNLGFSFFVFCQLVRLRVSSVVHHGGMASSMILVLLNFDCRPTTHNWLELWILSSNFAKKDNNIWCGPTINQSPPYSLQSIVWSVYNRHNVLPHLCPPTTNGAYWKFTWFAYPPMQACWKEHMKHISRANFIPFVINFLWLSSFSFRFSFFLDYSCSHHYTSSSGILFNSHNCLVFIIIDSMCP
jgi:hypothetical protein